VVRIDDEHYSSERKRLHGRSLAFDRLCNFTRDTIERTLCRAVIRRTPRETGRPGRRISRR
jgi:hypothetical protein